MLWGGSAPPYRLILASCSVIVEPPWSAAPWWVMSATPELDQSSEVPRAFGVVVVILDGHDRLLEVGRDRRQVDVNVAVALVVEDMDKAAGRVEDVGVDLRLHVGDGGRVGQLALVGVVPREYGADRPGSDRGHHGDPDEHDSQRASPLLRRMQVAVGARAPAAELRSRSRLGGADARIGRAVGAQWRVRTVRQARPAAPGFGGLIEGHACTVECIGEVVSSLRSAVARRQCCRVPG